MCVGELGTAGLAGWLTDWLLASRTGIQMRKKEKEKKPWTLGERAQVPGGGGGVAVNEARGRGVQRPGKQEHQGWSMEQGL